MATEKRGRVDSRVSEQDIAAAPKDTCVLCYNEIQYVALGSCGHTLVCAKCCLRVRLLMNDKTCSLCKQELDEIVITGNRGLTWEEFDENVRYDCDQDRQDESIYYTDRASKIEGMKLR